MKRKRKGELLRSKDVAHILDCSPDDVIDLARKAKLRAVKEGRYWKFRLSDVNAYKTRQGQGGKGRLQRRPNNHHE